MGLDLFLVQAKDHTFKKEVKMINLWNKPMIIHNWFMNIVEECENGEYYPVDIDDMEEVYRECFEFIQHYQNTLPDTVAFKNWTLKQILKRDIPKNISSKCVEIIKTLKTLDKILKKKNTLQDTLHGVCFSW